MKKKKPEMKHWTFDVTFERFNIHVTARTKGEARKKIIAKLNRKKASSYINRKQSYLDKDYWY